MCRRKRNRFRFRRRCQSSRLWQNLLRFRLIRRNPSRRQCCPMNHLCRRFHRCQQSCCRRCRLSRRSQNHPFRWSSRRCSSSHQSSSSHQNSSSHRSSSRPPNPSSRQRHQTRLRRRSLHRRQQSCCHRWQRWYFRLPNFPRCHRAQLWRCRPSRFRLVQWCYHLCVRLLRRQRNRFARRSANHRSRSCHHCHRCLQSRNQLPPEPPRRRPLRVIE